MKELLRRKETKIIAAVITILLLFVGLLVGTVKTNKTANPELAMEKTYNVITGDDEYADEGHHVIFSAFFARDLDGDGRDEKILGSCNNTKGSDTLLINVGVNSDGYLKDGKVTISAKQGNVKNFNYQVSMLAGEDDILAHDYVSNNVTTIEFKDIHAGRQKLINGNIRAAITSPEAYSSVNQVTLTGTFVPDEGEPYQINKTFDLNIDWYGTAETTISTSSSSTNVTYLNETDNIVAKVQICAGTKGLLTKERVVKAQIPSMFGIYPVVEYRNYGEEAEYSYDEESHILTINRTTTSSYSTDEIVLTYPSEIYEPLKARLLDNAQHNIYMPISAYSICYNNPNEGFTNPYQTQVATTSANMHFFITNDGGSTWNCDLSVEDKDILRAVQMNNGLKYEYGIDKDKFLELYDSEASKVYEYRTEQSLNISSIYKSEAEWTTVTIHNGDNVEEKVGGNYSYVGIVGVQLESIDPLNGSIPHLGVKIENGIFIIDGDKGVDINVVPVCRTVEEYGYLGALIRYKASWNWSEFIAKKAILEDDGALFGGYSSDSFTKTKAITFKDTSLIKPDGFIKIYNVDTDELIKEFTDKEWLLYSNGNKYEFDVDVSRIRIVTSEDDPIKGGTIAVTVYKEIDIDAMKQAIPRSEFERVNHFRQAVAFKVNNVLDVQSVKTIADISELYTKRSYADISANPNLVSAGDENKNIDFNVAVPGTKNQVYAICDKWVDGKFLVRIDKSKLTAFKLNSVQTNISSVVVDYYTLTEDDDYYYIEVQTKNTETETLEDGDATYTQIKAIDRFALNINADVSINPLTVASTVGIDLYYYNPNREMYGEQIVDTYDLDKDGNTNDYVGHYTSEIDIDAPNDFKSAQSITEYSEDEDEREIYAPGVVKVTTGRRNAKVNVQFANRYTSDILNFKLQGKIPFKNNTYVNGSSLGSTFSTKMTSDGITISDALADGSTIYYSEKEDPTDDITNAENGWTLKENVSSFDNIKSYLIVVENGKIKRGEIYKASYDIQIPEDIDSNEVSYCCFKASYDVYVNNGLLGFEVQPEKLGMRMVQYYDLELTKYKEGTDRLVTGPVFNLSGKLITAVNGKIKAEDLIINQEYSLEEVDGKDYEKKEGVIKFKVIKEGTGLKFVKLEDSTADFDGEVTFSQNAAGRYVLNSTIEDTPKVRMTLKKIDSATNEPLKDVKFVIDNSKLYSTDENGNITFDVSLNEVHNIREYPNDGYYKIEDITFTVKKVNNAYVIESNNEQFSSVTPTSDNSSDFVEAELTLENDQIPTYELYIQKIDKEREIPLKDVKFRLYKDDLNVNEDFTTDENGLIHIPNLYQYVEGKDITGKYTLREVSGKNGYLLNNEEIEFYVKKNSVNQLEIVITDEENLESIKEYSTTSKKVTLVITNKPLFKLIKVDAVNGELITTTKW